MHPTVLSKVLLFLVLGSGSCFASEERVTTARANTTAAIHALYKKAGVAYPPRKMLLRAFKEDKLIEVWAGDGKSPLALVTTYPVCAQSGRVGPKRREGDAQVPEGVYALDRFNPQSNFHLSLGLNYPNDSDRRRSKAKRLGGDIFIHGNCVTIGCLPIQDGPMEELYVMTVDARSAGAKPIVVHVFPARMTAENLARLQPLVTPETTALWKELTLVQEAFDATHVIPKVRIGEAGEYVVVK